MQTLHLCHFITILGFDLTGIPILWGIAIMIMYCIYKYIYIHAYISECLQMCVTHIEVVKRNSEVQGSVTYFQMWLYLT